ncbi:hypothetical protein Tco_0136196, partial [Tanacetum coccineum]
MVTSKVGDSVGMGDDDGEMGVEIRVDEQAVVVCMCHF